VSPWSRVTPTLHGGGLLGFCVTRRKLFVSTANIWPAHNFHFQNTTYTSETQHHTTTIMSKTVSFAPCPTILCTVPPVEAIDMENVYYQEQDYIRFRRELCQEQLFDHRIKARRHQQIGHELLTQPRVTMKRCVAQIGAHEEALRGIARTA
jgi:hypothetical protein